MQSVHTDMSLGHCSLGSPCQPSYPPQKTARLAALRDGAIKISVPSRSPSRTDIVWYEGRTPRKSPSPQRSASQPVPAIKPALASGEPHEVEASRAGPGDASRWRTGIHPRSTVAPLSTSSAPGHQLSLQRGREGSANLLIAVPIEENPDHCSGRAWGRGAGRAFPLCPGSSDVDLLCDGKGIIDLDAEVPHRAFDLGVTKQDLHGPQVAGAPVDQARLGSAKRVRTEEVGIQADTGDPSGD
jgi:hypothetical protein